MEGAIAMARKPKPISEMTSAQFETMFPIGDEDACKRYLAARRWPSGVSCPRCGNAKIYELKARPFHWQCRMCDPRGYRFSVRAGTVFHHTNKPLRDWLKVAHLLMTSKKRMSLQQIWRRMGFGSFQTAWYMVYRIRAPLIEAEAKLGGIVDVHETYIAARNKSRH
jgi:hypothetical protein